jgi:pimeloyl-ACP methyl ester carboxylesterase
MKFEIAGVSVHYEVRGEGRPAVMLHGWSLDRSETVFELESHFRGRTGWKRIYLDLPGFGLTPGADRISGSDDMLQLVLDFLDGVIPGGRFVAIGTSYGAYLALGLVQRRGSEMDGVMLSVPVIHADEAKRTRPPHTVLVKDDSFVKRARKEGFSWVEEIGVVLEPRLQEYAKVLNAVPAGDKSFQERVRKKYAFSFDVNQLEKPFPAPTLFLTGRQDNVVGYADAWKTFANYPRGTFAVLDRAGHLLWGEQGDLASALTSDWLDRVEEWARQHSTGGSG